MIWQIIPHDEFTGYFIPSLGVVHYISNLSSNPLLSAKNIYLFITTLRVSQQLLASTAAAAAAGAVCLFSSNVQQRKGGSCNPYKHRCDRNGGQTISAFEAKTHSTVWSNSRLQSFLTCEPALEHKMSWRTPAKWTVNIILKVIPLLLRRRLKDFSPASFQEALDLTHSQSTHAADSHGP